MMCQLVLGAGLMSFLKADAHVRLPFLKMVNGLHKGIK